jgi:predicted 2-oxoglutarate/Fe(II)-dependent dioxygenase YbiX
MKPLDPDPLAESNASGRYLRLPPVTFFPNFLGDLMCRGIRMAMDQGTGEPAEVLEAGTHLDEEARSASSIDVDVATLSAVEVALDEVRATLSARLGIPLGAREGPGFIRYGEGGRYLPHRDPAHASAWPAASRRLVSLVAFLNSAHDIPAAHEFAGGELTIYPTSRDGETSDPIRVVPREGLLVAFDASLLHEVQPVTAGSRDVIVDWIYEGL